MGGYCSFEGEERFPEFGLNLNRLPPGAPMAMYHHEPYQEGFLVLDGEAVLIIEGEERALKRWDYVHCPRDVPHVIVGGPTGAFVLAVGSRTGPRGVGYPVDEAALRTNQPSSPSGIWPPSSAGTRRASVMTES